MPRLTNSDYLLIRTHLSHVWTNKRQGFGLISTKDQRYLHDYFRLSESLSAADAIIHRRAISHERPSLPQQAGRALRHLADPPALKKPLTGKSRIVVHPILRPQPDIHRLVQALLALGRQLAEAEAKQEDVD